MTAPTKIIHNAFDIKPPKMPHINEEVLTQSPCETTCYTNADVVWDSNFPRGLEDVKHGEWHYGPRGE